MKLTFHYCQKWNVEALNLIREFIVFVNQKLKLKKKILPESKKNIYGYLKTN